MAFKIYQDHLKDHGCIDSQGRFYTASTDEVICPYCGALIDINGDLVIRDDNENDGTYSGTVTCNSCSCIFMVMLEISAFFRAYKKQD